MKRFNTVQKILFLLGVLIILAPIAQKGYNIYQDNIKIQEFVKKSVSEEEKQKLLKEKEKLEKEISDGEFNTEDFYSNTTKENPEIIKNIEPIGIITIPKIKLTSEIYQSIDDFILNKAIGVLPKTNLPYGSKNSNSVLVGHRGTHNYDLFRHLDKLEKDDYIFIENKLDKKPLAYKVIDYKIILPNQGDLIKIVPNKDLITLITCEPYLINSHRIVITAERDENYIFPKESISQEVIKSENLLIKILTNINTEYYYFFGILFLILLFKNKKKGKQNEEKNL